MIGGFQPLRGSLVLITYLRYRVCAPPYFLVYNPGRALVLTEFMFIKTPYKPNQILTYDIPPLIGLEELIRLPPRPPPPPWLSCAEDSPVSRAPSSSGTWAQSSVDQPTKVLPGGGRRETAASPLNMW